jgi:hypothetical protein
MRRTEPADFDMALRRLSILAFALLLSCAGPNDLAGHLDAAGVTAGFWRGLLHGVLAPITFLISLFTDRVSMYEVHNSGHWYDFGFLIGICAVLGGGAARRRAFRPPQPPPNA